MKREQSINALRGGESFDLLVIGGGATGAGIALDAASRNYRVALVEQKDFGSGTSSKSSKLVHGGVRYLANAEFGLVREALAERGMMLKNANHVVTPLSFIIPVKHVGEQIKYRVGLWLYDKLAGAKNFSEKKFARSSSLTVEQLDGTLSSLDVKQFSGAVTYSDARFDDTRLLWDILRRANTYGAVIANYCQAISLIKKHDKVVGVELLDRETGEEFAVTARAVINATGAWSDQITSLDQSDQPGTIVASQGTHIVVDRKFFPSKDALLIPKTSDGRVMFVIPWHDRVVIGTTDEALPRGSTEARPTDSEIDLILTTVGEYLKPAPTRADVLSCFAGIRPLSGEGTAAKTAKISREHRIDLASSGLITITGGKWTTYRLMAEECVNMMEKSLAIPGRKCLTKDLLIDEIADQTQFDSYGGVATALAALVAENPDLEKLISPHLPYRQAEVVWAVRHEMARSLMDILARRTRAIFLDAKATIACAPTVGEILRKELNKDSSWLNAQLETFETQAADFVASPPAQD